MKNSDTLNLQLLIASSRKLETSLPTVNIENCTLGCWVLENLTEVKIKDCSIIQNNTWEYHQIMIYIDNTSALLENITVEGIKFTSLGTVLVISSDSYVVMKSSTLSRNTGYTKSVIYACDRSILIMENCSLTENYLHKEPFETSHVIYIMGNTTFKMLDSHFTRNKAFRNVFGSNNVYIYVRNTQFTFNQAVPLVVSNTTGGDGGAIFCKYYCYLEISDCNFTGNKASSGGSICIGYNSIVIIAQSNFQNNSAGTESFSGWGGAIMADTNITLHVTDVIFIQNAATTYGGAIYTESNCNISLTGCYFSRNSALNPTRVDTAGGAAAFQDNSLAIVTNTTFQHNTAAEGGALFVTEFTGEFLVLISCCVFDGNSKTAISAKQRGVLNVLDSEFRNNSGELGGALLIRQGVELTVSSVFFNQNKAWTSGGAIYASKSRITNCTFNNNYAQFYGGALYFCTKAYLRDIFFNNNTASVGAGGTVFSKGRKLTMINCLLNNSTAVFGGAIYLEGSTSIIIHSIFKGNTARRTEGGFWDYSQGGGISAVGSRIYINDSHFSANQAEVSGAINFVGDIMKMVNVTFLKNFAALGAAAAGALGVNASVLAEMRNCHVIESYSRFGGGVSVLGNFVAINSTFIKNRCDYSFGGAIVLLSGAIGSFEECRLEGNHAYMGGAIELADITLKLLISKTSFVNNTAQKGQDIYYGSSVPKQVSEIKTDTYESTFTHTNFSISTSEEHFKMNAFNRNVIQAAIDVPITETPYASGTT